MDTLEFKTKIKELKNQLKELLAKYPNQRVDFEFNDDYECDWKDKCYSDGDFEIFYGHNWYCEDRCTVRSIYINDDDDLSFDLSYIAYDHEGNRQEDEELEDVTLDYIIEVTRSSDWDFILSQLNFFAEILIVSPTEESGADVEHKKYCPECGTEVKPEQKFCIECGTRLIESETLAPQPKSDEKSKKKSESKTSKKQKVAFQDLDDALILVSFDAVNPEDGDEANHGAIPYRFENGKLLHYNLDDVDVTEVDSSFNTDECKVRMRMPYDVDDYTSMDEFADEVIDDVAPDFIEELKNIDVEVVDNEFTFAIYNKNGDEVYSYTKVVSGDADDEGDLFSWDDDEEEDKPVAPPKKEKPSKKKSEQKPDKELDKKLNDLYKMAVACRIGKNGVERSEVLAMEYYQEYLEEAPTSHSKYLDAHYGMAELCTKMGDEGHSLGMDEDALDWYNEAVEHYEEIVKYPKKPFNDRLLAEVAYDKLRKKIAKLK